MAKVRETAGRIPSQNRRASPRSAAAVAAVSSVSDIEAGGARER
jgi:hypothetical protein